MEWKSIRSWYFDFSHPLYFDRLCQDSNLQRFQIILKPDLTSASLCVINTAEVTSHDIDHVTFEDYSICEDTLVTCWTYSDSDRDQHQCGVYTGLTSPPSANSISHGGPVAKMLLPNIWDHCVLFLCPASGQFVHLDYETNVIAVLRFFSDALLFICRGHSSSDTYIY